MEITNVVTVQGNRGIEIQADITDSIGSELRYSSMSGVLLLILKADDTRFQGDLLPSSGSTYFLPERLLSELQIKPGDKLKLVYSEDLGFIIAKKLEVTADEQ